MTQKSLTELQLAVMKVVWERGEVTVADVVERFAEQERDLAPTTLATLLQRLSKQGWLKARKAGRVLHYSARVEQRDAAKGALRQLMSAFFGGSPATLTAHLLEEDLVNEAELEEMKRLVEGRED